MAVEDTGGPGVAAGGGGAGGTRVVVAGGGAGGTRVVVAGGGAGGARVVVTSGADGPPGEDGVAAERIGVLGGTFDPVHIGHLVAAVNARHALDLVRVILMVANVPWQKAGQRVLTSAEDRLALVAAAVGDVPGLEAGRLEIDRGGESYTAETLVELASLHPGAELFLIVGWDVAAELTTWDRWEDIQSLATLVVVNRPGAGRPAGLDSDGWRVEEVIVPNLEISSTDLRARAAAGQPLDYLVPEAAVRCLRARGLYATNR